MTLGAAFRPWGWGANGFAWNDHAVIINNAPWRRTWVNRPSYAHPYEVRRYEPERRVEGHELHERTERERDAGRFSRRREEEHRRDDRRR